MMKQKGRIVDLRPGRGGFQRIIQGVKKDQQSSHDRDFIGSNGTYLASDETYPAIYAKVSVYDFDNKVIDIDIREIVMTHYDWKRITEKRVSELKEKLVGKKVVIVDGNYKREIENLLSIL